MKSSFLKILFLLFFIPTFIFSVETNNQSEEKVNEPQTETKNILDEKTIIEEKIKEQEKVTEEIIKNINEDKYLDTTFNERNYDKEINFLLNKININQREHNTLAVKRDEIRLLLLQEARFYNNTLKEISDAKNSFKDKEYIADVINNNIDLLNNNSTKKFKTIYEEEKNNDSKISEELISNYLELTDQSNQQLFTLNYLLKNISLYRKTNFFIDNFNLQYLISSIDKNPIIYPISKFTSYYMKFSIGEIIVVLFILLFVRLLVTRVIHFIISFFSNLLIKKTKKEDLEDINEEENDRIDILKSIQKSIERPLVLAVYLLSIQISMYILIKDNELLNKIIPWVNTMYMGLFTWAIYSLLSNSISNYAQHLIEKYPNMRREMIVFILRILKIILILLVILFLFTQLGIDIKAIAASLGVGGIAIALASKDTLANFFGSLNIMTDNSFSQGDWVVADAVEGTVVDIRMRTTRIRTFDNAMITVPNSELANTHIKNYSKRRIGRRIKMKLGITYESEMNDIINLKKDILEMLENHPQIATNKNITQNTNRNKKFEAIKREDLQGVKRTLLVYIDEYDSSSINILIYCFTRSPNWEDWLTVKEDVLIKISDLVKKNNCDFAYPTQTILVKK